MNCRIDWRTVVLREVAAFAMLIGLASCTPEPTPRAHRIGIIDGLDQPESVQYDAQQDVYFISNMAGLGSGHDGHGYITRVSAADLEQSEIFIQSGIGGAVLNAPKGIALHDGTLWVADITVLRSFDARDGAPRASYDLGAHGAVLLNGITTHPDGTVYVTDTGIVMSDVGVLYTDSAKIFSVGPDGTIAVVARGTQLRYPNGIVWDSIGSRLVVASFHPFGSEVYELSAQNTVRAVLARGPGRFDGLEQLRDGRFVVTSWTDSSLYVIADGTQQRIIRDLWQPADVGVDTRRNIVAIPLVLPGRVELWQLP